MNTPENSHIDITVVVPLFNEDESLPELHAWIKRVMDEHQFSHEVIFVDDGSTDRSWAIIEQISQSDPTVHFIKILCHRSKLLGSRYQRTRPMQKTLGSSRI